MASYIRLENGKVRVQLHVNGFRESKTLPAGKAKSWAREREVELSKLSAVVDDS